MSDVEPPIEPPADRPLDHTDASYYAIPRRRHPVLGVLVWSVVVLIGLGVAGALFANQVANRALSNPLNDSAEVKDAAAVLAPPPRNLPDRPTNILVIGSDRRPKDGSSGGRSDTIILVRLDFKRGFISMLSFPRDLYVPIPGYGQNKINAAYAFGSNKLAIETVVALTGERPDYFFNVDFNAFRRLVKDVGGVYIDVDHWYFNDNSGVSPSLRFEPLNILPGYQRLGPDDALDYVRYRHDAGDFARIARQQAFLSELKRQNGGAAGLNNIVDAIHDEVTTNLKSVVRLKDFLQFGLSIEKERIARVTVQETGEGSTSCCGSVVFTSPAKIAEAVDKWKNPEFQNEAPTKAADPASTTVAVYNGTNVLRLGSKVGAALQARGYQVLFGGNAPDGFYSSTSVFYAPGKRNEAKAVQALFGGQASIVQRRAGQPTDADVLVMVGSDYKGLSSPQAVVQVKERPSTIATTSLKRVVQNARAVTKMDLLVPLHLPTGSDVRWARLYNVVHGTQGKPDTLTFVVRLGGANRYFTITQTSMKDPPIVKTGTGHDKQGNITFYDGKKMQRLLWQRGDMTYWITNSLDESLSAATIRDIRQFMLRPARARLRKGQTDTRVPVQERSRTP
jgi:LCP family protein required for cell wall assembly